MGRTSKRKKSAKQNCKRARTALDANESHYRRESGSGVLGFSSEYYRAFQPDDSSSAQGSISTIELQSPLGQGSLNLEIPTDDSLSLNLVDDDEFEDEELSSLDLIDFVDLSEMIESSEEEDSSNLTEDSDACQFSNISFRGQRWRKAQFRSQIDKTLKDLLELGEKQLDSALAIKLLLDHILDDFEEELAQRIAQRFENSTRAEYAEKICRKFRTTPLRTQKRVEIASKIFDVFGNLIYFGSQKEARAALRCCTSTYQKARRHAIVFGPGCIRPKYHRKRMKPMLSIMQELEMFAEDKMALRLSSFQSTSDGTPVNYLTDTVSALWRAYKSDHPSGVGRTLFFRYFANSRFQRMDLLGGLCSVCNGTAYLLRESTIKLSRRFCPAAEKELTLKIDQWIRHVRLSLMPVNQHVASESHCFAHAMGHGCEEHHDLECSQCMSIFKLFEDLRPLIVVQNQNDLHHVLYEDLPRLAKSFMGHRFRTAHTKQIHAQALQSISETHCVIILDFKQKLFRESGREAQQDWFGKNAFASLHGAAILTQQQATHRIALISQDTPSGRYRKPNSKKRTSQRVSTEVQVEFIDIYSQDTTQDSIWVMNAVELVSLHLSINMPHLISVEIWCDNATCYHNSEFSRFAPLIFQQNGLLLRSMRFFEAGEGKSLLDRHFATVRHSVLERITSGHSFESLIDIREVLERLSSVHCYQITPNRTVSYPVLNQKIPQI